MRKRYCDDQELVLLIMDKVLFFPAIAALDALPWRMRRRSVRSRRGKFSSSMYRRGSSSSASTRGRLMNATANLACVFNVGISLTMLRMAAQRDPVRAGG